MMKAENKIQFRGKYKNTFCKWLQFNRKTHIIESNDDDDWDNGELINGHKQLQHIYRRPGIFNIRKNLITYWFCMFSTHHKYLFCKK
jgi:hypothetical protein